MFDISCCSRVTGSFFQGKVSGANSNSNPNNSVELGVNMDWDLLPVELLSLIGNNLENKRDLGAFSSCSYATKEACESALKELKEQDVRRPNTLIMSRSINCFSNPDYEFCLPSVYFCCDPRSDCFEINVCHCLIYCSVWAGAGVYFLHTFPMSMFVNTVVNCTSLSAGFLAGNCYGCLTSPLNCKLAEIACDNRTWSPIRDGLARVCCCT